MESAGWGGRSGTRDGSFPFSCPRTGLNRELVQFALRLMTTSWLGHVPLTCRQLLCFPDLHAEVSRSWRNPYFVHLFSPLLSSHCWAWKSRICSQAQGWREACELSLPYIASMEETCRKSCRPTRMTCWKITIVEGGLSSMKQAAYAISHSKATLFATELRTEIRLFLPQGLLGDAVSIKRWSSSQWHSGYLSFAAVSGLGHLPAALAPPSSLRAKRMASVGAYAPHQSLGMPASMLSPGLSGKTGP